MNDPGVNLPTRYTLGQVIVNLCGNPAEGVLIGMDMKLDEVTVNHFMFETAAERHERRDA